MKEEANTFNNEQMLCLGTTLQGGKYRIERYLACGGFGNTYVVFNTVFEELFAMKEFFMKGVSARDADNTTVCVFNTADGDHFAEQKEKFKKEAQRLRKLRDKHLVFVHDFFEENGTAYYVMDYVKGESLSAILKKRTSPFTEAESLDVFCQVLDALAVVHEKNIWHLDLKPGNIIIDHNGTAIVIDFGASKQLSDVGSYTMTTTSMAYTKGYAPSEQIDQDLSLIGPWTDLYALGATLYNMLTLQKPPSISEINDGDAFAFPDDVSEKTRHLVCWLMSPNRKNRPQSVAEVREYLAVPFSADAESQMFDDDTLVGLRAQQDNGSTGRKCVNILKCLFRKKWFKALLALLLLLAVGVAVSRYVSKSEPQPAQPAAQKSAAVKSVQGMAYEFKGIGKGKYTGKLDKKNKPHDAQAVVAFDDGRRYEGPLAHGVMEGKKAKFTFPNGDIYEGSVKGNYFDEGRYTSKADGSYFVGKFKAGQPSSSGVWYDKSGKVIQ